MDEDGYPTEEELNEIETFNGELDDFLETVRVLWSYPDRFCLKGKRVLRLYLSTGGWSGNESVIGALKNTFFWYFFWEKSVRGGHYWFKIPLRRVKDFTKWGRKDKCSK